MRGLTLLMLALAAPPTRAAAPEVGVYYFPGWHRDPFSGNRDPWQPIRAYPDRMPRRGAYDDRGPTVLKAQAAQMARAGIGFVVFDWYYEQGVEQAATPLRAYLGSGVAAPRAALIWCRHGSVPPTTAAEWRTIVRLWAGYARRPGFYRIGGRPVVFVFDTARMAREAALAGSDLAGWIRAAQAIMRQAGLPPIHFVAGTWNGDDPTIARAARAGFAAISSYNYRRAPGDARDAHGYAELDRAYRRIWPRLAAGALPVILPLTAGWDRRPWGGSADPARDPSTPTDRRFRAHLAAARAFMTAHRIERTVICCWNEYGEGSVIEPTRADGDAKLRAIRDILAPGRRP